MAVKDIGLQTDKRRPVRTGGCTGPGSRVAAGTVVCGLFWKEKYYAAESTQGTRSPGAFYIGLIPYEKYANVTP